MNTKVMLLAGAFAVLVGSPAWANVYDFSFSGDNGVSGSGVLITGAVGSPYTVTGAIGTIVDDQGALSGLGPFTINGLSLYGGADNLLYYPASGSPANYVDFGGISFTTATGVDFNFNLGLGGNTGTGAVLNDGVNDPAGYGVPTFGSNNISLSVSAVPELSTWAMMLLGFAGLGFAGYRGSRKEATLPA